MHVVTIIPNNKSYIEFFSQFGMVYAIVLVE